MFKVKFSDMNLDGKYVRVKTNKADEMKIIYFNDKQRKFLKRMNKKYNEKWAKTKFKKIPVCNITTEESLWKKNLAGTIGCHAKEFGDFLERYLDDEALFRKEKNKIMKLFIENSRKYSLYWFFLCYLKTTHYTMIFTGLMALFILFDLIFK